MKHLAVAKLDRFVGCEELGLLSGVNVGIVGETILDSGAKC